MLKNTQSRAGRKPRFDARRQKLYLEALAESGVMADAMRAAGVSSRATLKNARERDPEFAELENDALESAADRVESFLHTRSLFGQEVPVVDEHGRAVMDAETGQPRTAFIPPDNKLLLARAKAMRPEKYATERKHISNDTPATMVYMPVVECAAEFERMLEDQRQKTDEVLSRGADSAE